MSDQSIIGRDFISILPGNYHATDKAECLSTLLGSCVAACLYDPVNHVIGMNHFLLSGTLNRYNVPLLLTESARYGIHAMEKLINAMLKLGAERENLRCKAFGGATMFGPHDPAAPGVGQMNCLFIRDFLRKEKIPLVAQDLGGTHGRVIYFMPEDYSVMMRRIKKSRLRDIAHREQRLLQRTQQRQQPKNRDELWD
jgi:chemotaxis protein CheD